MHVNTTMPSIVPLYFALTYITKRFPGFIMRMVCTVTTVIILQSIMNAEMAPLLLHRTQCRVAKLRDRLIKGEMIGPEVVLDGRMNAFWWNLLTGTVGCDRRPLVDQVRGGGTECEADK